MAAHSRFQTIAAVALLAIAAAIWAYWMWPASFDAEQLRQVDGIDVQVTSVRVTGPVLRVRCRVANRSQQMARQIVLTAQVKEPSGKVVAVNPLVSVSGLEPGKSCETEILVPGGGRFRHCRAEVEPTLVRWE